jgi:hypothetical protein
MFGFAEGRVKASIADRPALPNFPRDVNCSAQPIPALLTCVV